MDAKSKYTAFERPYCRTICWEQIFEIHPRFWEINAQSKRDKTRHRATNATKSDKTRQWATCRLCVAVCRLCVAFVALCRSTIQKWHFRIVATHIQYFCSIIMFLTIVSEIQCQTRFSDRESDKPVPVSRFVALLSLIVAFCRSLSRLVSGVISKKRGWISKICSQQIVLQ